ncbi:ABC transporter substrate-binding protein [candidate division KSB3 bacterium]|uniref:ABC transporter substrate-binding protein n=1 Tax=candidate division KSB3 bacterium TaxID=2044937 RepID=A0A2G6K7C9_9BACT|nr:MAG: ABC transporter substrate-binding protein [candidate division KSB3 bacterium]
MEKSTQIKKILLVVPVVLMSFAVMSAGVGEAAQADALKTLNMALFWLDSNIEPTESWNGWTLARCGVGENLVQIDEHMKFKPAIATSWEQVDEKTTIFTIREGVTFHNGNPVDAEACKASIERTLEISNREDVKFPVESITADGFTLTIKTKSPYATLINNLADTPFIIVDASAAKTDENFKFKPIATGPFKVIDFNADTGMTLEKHAEHWSGDVGVDVVNVKYIQDASVRTMALQSGEIDLASQLTAKDLTLFEGNDDYVVLKAPNLRIFLLRINMEKPYMQSLEFRQALAYGIEKETYARKIVNGIPAKGPFNDLLPFGYPGDDFYTYNPEKARELLDSAGFTDTDGDGIREANGENIVMKYLSRTNHGPDANNIGIAMQAQYKEIGLGLEVLQVENYADMAATGDFDFLWERWTSAPTADPRYFLDTGFRTGASGNRGHYSNPEFDALLDTLSHAIEKSERDALGIQGSEILMKDVAALFLYYQEGNLVTSSRVEGVHKFISEVYYIDERVTIK